jgi:hypothetical protein
MSVQIPDNKKIMNNASSVISSSNHEDTIVIDNTNDSNALNNSILNKAVESLESQQRQELLKKDQKIADVEENIQIMNYKITNLVSNNSSSSTEIIDLFNDKSKRGNSNTILPSSLKITINNDINEDENFSEPSISTAVEAKEFMEGLSKLSTITSSPVNPHFNSFDRKSNTPISSNPLKSVNNISQNHNTLSTPANINNSNTKINSFQTKPSSSTIIYNSNKVMQKGDIKSDEVSFVVGGDSQGSFAVSSFEEDTTLIADDLKRQSYCSVSSDPDYRLSISSISNIDLNNKRQSFYSSASSNSNSISSSISNFSTEIIQISGITPPSSPIISKLNNTTTIKSINNTSVSTMVASLQKEVKEEKDKEQKVPFGRSVLPQIDQQSISNKMEIRNEKENKDTKMLSESQISYRSNLKSRPKGIKINTSVVKDDISIRGRPTMPFKGNIFVKRSHSQGSNGSSPVSREIALLMENRKVTRRNNRSSDPCTPTSLRHNKSTSYISSSRSSPVGDVPISERINALSLKSKIQMLKSSEDESLRRSNSYSCIQVSRSSSSSSTFPDKLTLKNSSSVVLGSTNRPTLRTSSSMVLSSSEKSSLKSSNSIVRGSTDKLTLTTSSSMILGSSSRKESTKLNPLVDSDDENQTPQKVIDNLNKLNGESKKGTLSECPKIILSMASFIGIILVNKSNQLLHYFEERYPKLQTAIAIIQTIVKYFPHVVIRVSEILYQGYHMLMIRTNLIRNYLIANNISFPDIHLLVSLLNQLKNQIIEKIMLARDGQLQLPFNLRGFLVRIQQLLNKTSPKKGRLSFSKNDIQIQNITISGPVGGHPMGANDSFQFNFDKKSDEQATVSVKQDDLEIPMKKVDQEEQEGNISNKPTSPYDESRIITKTLYSDTVVMDSSYSFFRPVHRQNHENNKNDIKVGNNSIMRYGMDNGSGRRSHRGSTTSNGSINDPIVKDNVSVNNLIELFEKQTSQQRKSSKTLEEDNNTNGSESVSLPSQAPQANPRTHSLKYSLSQRKQKTNSMVSDDLVSISTSDSSEFDKMDFDENLGNQSMNISFTGGHRRSHSQPDDSFLDDKEEEVENEVSLSQEVSTELRQKFNKIQEKNDQKREPLRSQSMIFVKEKFLKNAHSDLFKAVKNLKPVSSLSSIVGTKPSPRLSVPSLDIRNNNDNSGNNNVKNSSDNNNNVMNSPDKLMKSPSFPVSKAQSLAFKREKIVEELFHTEKTYVKELASIVHLYLDPLDTVPGHFLDMQEYRILFGNLRDIFDFHNEVFAPRLEKSCFPDRNKSIVPPPSVGSFFQLNAPVLANLYGEYYTNSNMANNFLTRIQNSKSSRFSTSIVNNKPKEAIFKKENKKRLKKFKTFLQWVCGQPEHTQMSLQGYLLLPVQRLPRYLLLLEQLLKNTLETDKEYRDLNRAKEAIRMVVEQCNERIRRFEEKKRVIELISNVRLCSSNVHSKMIKSSSSAHNKRLLLDTVPAKTKVEFFVKLQNLTKLEDLKLIKEGQFQIYKVKQCNPTSNTNSKSNRKPRHGVREPSDFSNSPALRAQRVAMKAVNSVSNSESEMKNDSTNNNVNINNTFSSVSLNSVSPMIYNTVMKMSKSSNSYTSSAASSPPSSIRRRKNRRRSSLESLSPPFIKMLVNDKINGDMIKKNKLLSKTNNYNNHDDNISDNNNNNNDDDNNNNNNVNNNDNTLTTTTTTAATANSNNNNNNKNVTLKRTLSTIEDTSGINSEFINSLTSNDLDNASNILINPSSAIWERVYLINNNLIEVLSSTNELVRIMELVKPKIGHLPNSILNPGCQVDIVTENGIQMLTVCDGQVMIYLMGLKNELYEWKEAIEKIIQ